MTIPTTIPVREYEKFRESGALPGKTVVAVVFDEPQPVTIDNVTIENANLFVQLTHEDDDPTSGQIHDSVRIGDGTELLEITTSNEAKVSDATTHTTLTAIEADTTSIATDASTIAGDTTSIDSKLNTLGQKTMAGSVPVVLPSDQIVPISAVSLPLPTGASTSALQTSGNASLTSIDGKLVDNYGVATAALRTASQIGNTTGQADFAAGNSSAQTLRTVIATDQAPIATKNPQTGTTTQFAATIGVTPTAFPTVAGGVISEVLVRCDTDNTPNSERLFYSFDGGVTYGKLAPGEFVGWPLRGNITQIYIYGSTASVQYEIIMNREP